MQGPGQYLCNIVKSNYQFITYEEWLSQQIAQIKELKLRPTTQEIEEYQRLLKKVIAESRPRLSVELARVVTPEILLKIYLRSKDCRHPKGDSVIFKYFLHLIYFNQGLKQSYRSLYFPIQDYFTDIVNSEAKAKYKSLFRRVRELDEKMHPYEDVLVVTKWLGSRKIFQEQSKLGIAVISKYKKQVLDYLNDGMGFDSLVKLLAPKVRALNLRKYSRITDDSKDVRITSTTISKLVK